jgi:hypothetical protein
MLRLLIRLFTIIALVAALTISLWWCMNPTQDWLQAPSTALALIAAVSGIPADRWAAEAQSRTRALVSLRHELDQNTEILADSRFLPESQSIGQVYPRLMLGAVDTAFISGVFASPRDRELLRRLLTWRNTSEDFNRRLDITEIRLCTIERLSGDELSALRDMAKEPQGYFALVVRQMGELREALEQGSSPLGRRVLARYLKPKPVEASAT